MADREVEDDNYTPPSEDEASLDDDEFVIPSDPAENELFKCRLLATASSLKKKQQQLKAAQEYELECPSKSYPKRRPLPRSEEEAPTSPAHDMQNDLENREGQTRSIYGSRGCAPTRNDDHQAGYNKYKPVRAEYHRPAPSELRPDVAWHRGATHPLCFTNEVMEHKIPEGFKPCSLD